MKPKPHLLSLGAFLRIFLGYIRPHRSQAVGVLLLLAVDVGFKTAWPLSFKFLIDHALVPSVFLSLRRQQFSLLLEKAPQILVRLRQGRPAPAGPTSTPISSP